MLTLVIMMILMHAYYYYYYYYSPSPYYYYHYHYCDYHLLLLLDGWMASFPSPFSPPVGGGHQKNKAMSKVSERGQVNTMGWVKRG